jgi:hypothetical protein
MSKGSFTSKELEIWNSIYGASRGPSSFRLKILVEDFARHGLTPAMMRIGDDTIPYDAGVFSTSLADGIANKDDDHVQAYYHPAECEQAVGPSASAWTQWSQLILEVTGLAPKDSVNHPIVIENVPRISLPVPVRDALLERGLKTAPKCRLISARMVAFFVAAQYRAWGTQEQVARVSPFKESIRKCGFKVEPCDVRRGTGVDEAFQELNNKPDDATLSADDILDAISLDEDPKADLVEDPKADPPQGGSMHHLDGGKWVLTPEGYPVLAEEQDPEQEIEAEIRRTEERLSALRQQQERLRVEASRRSYMEATIHDVVVDGGGTGTLAFLTLRFPGGNLRTYRVSEASESSS